MDRNEAAALDRHITGNHGEDGVPEDTWDHYAENAETIRFRRESLKDNLITAQRAIQAAISDILDLVSPGVYDIEFAEGAQGPDIRHHLDDAARALRAAEAIRRTVAEEG